VERVAMELVEKVKKEEVDKVVEEERQRKNAKNRDGDRNPVDLDILETSIIGTGEETIRNILGL